MTLTAFAESIARAASAIEMPSSEFPMVSFSLLEMMSIRTGADFGRLPVVINDDLAPGWWAARFENGSRLEFGPGAAPKPKWFRFELADRHKPAQQIDADQGFDDATAADIEAAHRSVEAGSPAAAEMAPRHPSPTALVEWSVLQLAVYEERHARQLGGLRHGAKINAVAAAADLLVAAEATR